MYMNIKYITFIYGDPLMERLFPKSLQGLAISTFQVVLVPTVVGGNKGVFFALRLPLIKYNEYLQKII